MAASQLTIPQLLELVRRRLETEGLDDSPASQRRSDSEWDAYYAKWMKDSDQIAAQVRYQYNLRRPVNVLPTEVITAVFIHLQETTAQSVMSLFSGGTTQDSEGLSTFWVGALTSVCQLWRGIALSTTALWQHLHLPNGGHGADVALRQFLDRSDPLPIRLRFCLSEVHDVSFSVKRRNVFSKMITDEPQRFETLHLTGNTLSESGLKPTARSGKFSRLLQLRLDHRGVNENLLLNFGLAKMPSLTRLSLLDAWDFHAANLPRSPTLLSHLIFHRNLHHGCVNTTMALRFLEATPLLQVLVFETKCERLHDRRVYPGVKLPCLKYLKLHEFSRAPDADSYPILLLPQLSIPQNITMIWNLPRVSLLNAGLHDRNTTSLGPHLSGVRSVLVCYDPQSYDGETYELHNDTIIATYKCREDHPTGLLRFLQNVESLALLRKGISQSFDQDYMSKIPFRGFRTLHLNDVDLNSDALAAISKGESCFQDLLEVFIWIPLKAVHVVLYQVLISDRAFGEALLRSEAVERQRNDGTVIIFRVRYGDMDSWRSWDTLEDL